MLPAYAGGSVANLPVSVLRAFGAQAAAEPLLEPLDGRLLPSDLLSGARVVVVIVVDGLSAAMWSRDGLPFEDVPPRRTQTITSVFPSTTAAALTSLQYGAAPASHGMVGYTVYLPAVGRVVNLVRFKPLDGTTADPRLLDPRRMVAMPSVFDRLRDVGVDAVVVSHEEYARSPLTLAQSGDTDYEWHRTPAELAWRLLDVVRRPGRRFVFGYWAGVDMLAHSWGPSGDATRLDLQLLQRALVEGFLRPLAASGDDVAVVLTADHGHTDVAPDRQLPLSDLVRAVKTWAAPPTGERRAVGLTPPASAREMLEDAVRGRGVVLPVAEAKLHGLFGPPPHHPELLRRVGDLLLLAKASESFPYRDHRDGKPHAPGAHGSLTRDEMLVPLLVWRFGR